MRDHNPLGKEELESRGRGRTPQVKEKGRRQELETNFQVAERNARPLPTAA